MFLFDFRPWEWLTIGAIGLTIVIVNKAVIHDRGNNRAGLLLVSFYVGVVICHAGRWVRRRN